MSWLFLFFLFLSDIVLFSDEDNPEPRISDGEMKEWQSLLVRKKKYIRTNTKFLHKYLESIFPNWIHQTYRVKDTKRIDQLMEKDLKYVKALESVSKNNNKNLSFNPFQRLKQKQLKKRKRENHRQQSALT